MIEEAARVVWEKYIKKKYPHLEYPANVYARITKVKDNIDHYEYNIKVLDKNLDIDVMFPEVPGIKSKLKVEVNRTVAVALMYGELEFFIIGEVV